MRQPDEPTGNDHTEGPPDAQSIMDVRVLGTFLDEQGRIRAFPAQQKKYLVLLRHVVNIFEPGRRYPEPEVNTLLSRFNEDTARLRRSLVEFGLMRREGGGRDYWRAEDAPHERTP